MSLPAPDSTPTSRLPGFHALSPAARRGRLQADGHIPPALAAALEADLDLEQASLLVENAVGLFSLPLSIATNFRIDGTDCLIPMAIEEPSVVAAASKAAKMARTGGGFMTRATGNVMIGQIQLMEIDNFHVARQSLLDHRPALLQQVPVSRSVAAAGGGPTDLQIRYLPDTEAGPMLILHLLYDVGDAMGANIMNTALEALAPRAAQLARGRAVTSILSNLADQRLATAQVLYPWYALDPDPDPARQCLDAIVRADAWARTDPYRAATHNKGILNGIGSVVLATGNDWRAASAGAHAWAARSGHYQGLTRWTRIPDGATLPDPWARRPWTREPRPALFGTLTLPLALGTVGGLTRIHPGARAALALLGAPDARQLARQVAAVGLAQNLAALYALTREGIQRGHMRMHARQIALAAHIPPAHVAQVAARMVAERTMDVKTAQRIWHRMQMEEDTYATP